MAKNKTTLRYWLRTDRLNKDGSAPIHLIYQIQGQRKYYAIPDTKLFPVNWNSDSQLAIYRDKKSAKKLQPGIDFNILLSSAEATEINTRLERVRADITDIESRFKLDKVTFSPQMVIEALKYSKHPETKKDLPGTSLTAFIHQFVNDHTSKKKPGTLKVYSGLAAHLTEFEKKRAAKFTFEKIDNSFLSGFHSFLSEVKHRVSKKGKAFERNMNNVTAAKQMSTLKTLLNYARIEYKIPVNPDYKDFKIERKDSDLEVITLTQDEFTDVYNLDLSKNKSLDAIRDVFCFACATGLRFSDLQQLRREHIRKDNTLRMTSVKGGQKLVIPLNPISFSILHKYADRLKPLPVISNQKTNSGIKKIGELAGIDTPIEKVRTHGVKKVTRLFKKYELLSIHVGRKSFITLSLEKGIAIQEVMSLSGHTTFKAFRRYVDVNDKRKKTVMADAWGKVESTKLKVV